MYGHRFREVCHLRGQNIKNLFRTWHESTAMASRPPEPAHTKNGKTHEQITRHRRQPRAATLFPATHAARPPNRRALASLPSARTGAGELL
jgi:hypothetical protein